MYNRLQKHFLLLKLLIVLWTICLTIIIGCNSPQKLLSKDFAKIYTELRIATEGNRHRPKNGNETRRLILAKYGITLQEFEQEMNLLKKNKQHWIRFQNEVIQHVEKLQKIKATK